MSVAFRRYKHNIIWEITKGLKKDSLFDDFGVHVTQAQSMSRHMSLFNN